MPNNADTGDDMTMTAWVLEHGNQVAATLIAECGAPDVWLLGPLLASEGFTLPARIGVRPALVPRWRAVYRLDPPDLAITHPNGTLFFTGPLPELPPRWTFAAGELGWCVLYVVLGVLPFEYGDVMGNVAALRAAAQAGRVLAGRVAITPAAGDTVPA